MTSSVTNPVKAFALIALGLAIAAMGIYVANADDAPGAAVIGFLLMLAAVLFGVRTARNRLPIWAGRTALAVGVLISAFAAFLTHAVTVGRCCTNPHWPARCPPTGSSPADAIRHWSAEGGHPIEDPTADDDLTPLPCWAPGAKAIADDGLVAEERVLHPALTMVP